MFDLDSLVTKNHLVRSIDSIIDFEFIREEVKSLYSQDIGRPSIDSGYYLRCFLSNICLALNL